MQSNLQTENSLTFTSNLRTNLQLFWGFFFLFRIKTFRGELQCRCVGIVDVTSFVGCFPENTERKGTVGELRLLSQLESGSYTRMLLLT